MAAENFSGREIGRARRIGKTGRAGRIEKAGRNGVAEIINKFFWTLTYFLYFCRRLIRGAVIG